MGGTPHPLARGFLGGQGRVEGGTGFQHGAGDVEEAVGNRPQGTAVTVTATSERGVFGPACDVMLHGDARPVIHGVGEPVVAGLFF